MSKKYGLLHGCYDIVHLHPNIELNIMLEMRLHFGRLRLHFTKKYSGFNYKVIDFSNFLCYNPL